METEKSDKLLVRSAYLTRCEWCGTPYSPEWVGTKQGHMFCSTECQSAAHSESGKTVGACLIILGLVMLVPGIIGSTVSHGIAGTVFIELFFCGFLTMVWGFCALGLAIEARSYRDRKDKYRNAELLVCEYCNHINVPGVVACDNCGATLVGADFALDPWPEWFMQPPRTRGKYGPCRDCGRSSQYPVLSADGEHRCPKCGRILQEITVG